VTSEPTNDLFQQDSTTWQGLGYEILLERTKLGTIKVHSGHLVVCDPIDSPFTDPIDLDIPPGEYPVHMFVAELRDQRSVAFLNVVLDNEDPKQWVPAPLLGEHDEEEVTGGFHIHSGYAAILDVDTADILIDLQEDDDEEFIRQMSRELGRSRRLGLKTGAAVFDVASPTSTPHNYAVLEVAKGRYPIWIGSTRSGKPTMIVVDFKIIDVQFTRFGLRF
jgi:hypothetical protein